MITIDYCWENDDFINLECDEVDVQQLRNRLELLLINEGAHRNTWGEIYYDTATDEYSVTVNDRDPEDCIE